ncbi:MAG: hypothetical protein KKC46_00280 [Proteobacteria bacterium]|nr:hypothetical protein [Pseudomonadota bacterium]
MIIKNSLYGLFVGSVFKRKANLVQLICLLFFIPLLFPACSSNQVKPELLSTKGKIEKVLVLRFKNYTDFCGKENNIRCPLCGSMFFTGDIAENADVMLTNHLFSLLEKNTDFKIIPPDRAEFIADDFQACFQDSKAMIDKIVEIGQAVGADAVYLGHIYRFKQRVGTGYGVESPASVAFDLHLISVSERRIIWTGHMDETQRPLSENLFEIGTFIKRGGKWVVAEDLAKPGLEEMIHIFFTK